VNDEWAVNFDSHLDWSRLADHWSGSSRQDIQNQLAHWRDPIHLYHDNQRACRSAFHTCCFRRNFSSRSNAYTFSIFAHDCGAETVQLRAIADSCKSDSSHTFCERDSSVNELFTLNNFTMLENFVFAS
jgi:hypothetical protein